MNSSLQLKKITKFLTMGLCALLLMESSTTFAALGKEKKSDSLTFERNEDGEWSVKTVSDDGQEETETIDEWEASYLAKKADKPWGTKTKIIATAAATGGAILLGAKYLYNNYFRRNNVRPPENQDRIRQARLDFFSKTLPPLELAPAPRIVPERGGSMGTLVAPPRLKIAKETRVSLKQEAAAAAATLDPQAEHTELDRLLSEVRTLLLGPHQGLSKEDADTALEKLNQLTSEITNFSIDHRQDFSIEFQIECYLHELALFAEYFNCLKTNDLINDDLLTRTFAAIKVLLAFRNSYCETFIDKLLEIYVTTSDQDKDEVRAILANLFLANTKEESDQIIQELSKHVSLEDNYKKIQRLLNIIFKLPVDMNYDKKLVATLLSIYLAQGDEA